MPANLSAQLLRQLAAEAAETAQSIVDPELRLQVLLIAARYTAMAAAAEKFAVAGVKPDEE